MRREYTSTLKVRVDMKVESGSHRSSPIRIAKSTGHSLGFWRRNGAQQGGNYLFGQALVVQLAASVADIELIHAAAPGRGDG